MCIKQVEGSWLKLYIHIYIIHIYVYNQITNFHQIEFTINNIQLKTFKKSLIKFQRFKALPLCQDTNMQALYVPIYTVHIKKLNQRFNMNPHWGNPSCYSFFLNEQMVLSSETWGDIEKYTFRAWNSGRTSDVSGQIFMSKKINK